MSTEEDVRKASQRFYLALNRMANGDSSLMAEVWSDAPTVTTMHPIGGRDVGWEAVRASFEGVARLATKGQVELKDQLIQVIGDTAYELGVEKGSIEIAGHLAGIEHRVTNIYERRGGAWKLVHHHTDTSPAMIEVLGKLGSQ